MSRLQRIAARVFHGDTGLASREWASAAKFGDHQPPPYERTAMAPPADVALVLAARAEREGLGDAWRRSLEGLLALLGIEDSARGRQALAGELNIDAGEPGTSRHDAALYEALMQRLAENGAVAPESFFK
ncbi:DUF3597 family protein [Phenylobacterium sp.]|uniref:DUF3597 family protein n=1 Tax=Phenylobacterium sp. TaxID=1871053 RepID=UPI0025E65756|nr:DUF3597 family protein [Phenylobacterium sp.]